MEESQSQSSLKRDRDGESACITCFLCHLISVSFLTVTINISLLRRITSLTRTRGMTIISPFRIRDVFVSMDLSIWRRISSKLDFDDFLLRLMVMRWWDWTCSSASIIYRWSLSQRMSSIAIGRSILVRHLSQRLLSESKTWSRSRNLRLSTKIVSTRLLEIGSPCLLEVVERCKAVARKKKDDRSAEVEERALNN